MPSAPGNLSFQGYQTGEVSIFQSTVSTPVEVLPDLLAVSLKAYCASFVVFSKNSGYVIQINSVPKMKYQQCAEVAYLSVKSLLPNDSFDLLSSQLPELICTFLDKVGSD
ncbi:hypothetical protein CEXT_509351 [Caerostris extrusa]|uniref:Uncharacterized protein n=1 Tax=Caerostris extrusa TaxID=172846 RepID=A0AAV4MT73_CAEEX|nr:hypothetical protein CEXT_509351 [Caerostris extrusa]